MSKARLQPRKGRGIRAVAALLLVSLAVVVAACGGDDDSDAGSTDDVAEQTTNGANGDGADANGDEGSEQATTDDPGVTDYVEYVAGEAGPADESLSPVKIGWVNNEGGSIDPVGPTATAAARFAETYINENLGGVQGHPVQLEECFVRNAEEEGLQCAQQFLNDDAVHAVALGAVAVGADTINSTIDGQKPIILGVSFTPATQTAPNTYILFGANEYTVYPWGSFGSAELDAESAAVVYPEGPGLQDTAQAIARGNEAAGIETELVGFNPERADLVGALTAAGAQDADMITPMVAGPDCVAANDALNQLGIDPGIVVGSSLCLVPDLLDGFGGDYPQWIYGVANDVLANDPPTPAGEAFRSALAEYGEEENAFDPWWPVTFSQILTTTRFMNQVAAEEGGVEQITPEAISQKVQAFEGPLLAGPPGIECGKYPEAPASCNDQARFVQYNGDDSFTAVGPFYATPEPLQEELGVE